MITEPEGRGRRARGDRRVLTPDASAVVQAPFRLAREDASVGQVVGRRGRERGHAPALVMVVLGTVAVLCVPAAATAAEARSSTVAITACGQVITTDAVLRTDLTCAGDAMTIGASGVTVRLNGHTIRSSDGVGAGIDLGVERDVHGRRHRPRWPDLRVLRRRRRRPRLRASPFECPATTMTDNTWGFHLGFDYDVGDRPHDHRRRQRDRAGRRPSRVVACSSRTRRSRSPARTR